MKIAKYGLAIVALAAMGCSHAGTATSSAAGGGAAPQKTGGPTPAGVQADIAKVNADSNLSAAQKQIMLNQMNHAQGMPPRQAPP